MSKRKIKILAGDRVFGGKKFHLADESAFFKRNAKSLAEEYRKKGYNARIVKGKTASGKTRYYIYIRKKGR